MNKKKTWPDHKKSIENCGKFFKILHNDTDTEIKVIKCRCKSNFCPVCFNHKIITHRRQIRAAFRGIKRIRFMTLTLKKTDIVGDLKRVNKFASKFLKRLRTRREWFDVSNQKTVKLFNRDLKYYKQVEIGTDENVHVHFMLNKFIPVKLIKQLWFETTKDSFIVDIRSNKNLDTPFLAVKYMTDYMTCSLQDEYKQSIYEANIRMYSMTKNLIVKKIKDSAWKFFNLISYNKNELISFIQTTWPMYKKIIFTFLIDGMPRPPNLVFAYEKK